MADHPGTPSSSEGSLNSSLSVDPAFVWKFGYGSNLSVKNLLHKKGLNILEWAPSRVDGWALVFNMEFQRKIEPAMANIVPSKEDSVHGSVVKITKEDGEALDRQEPVYKKVPIEVICYDGRKILAEVYVGKETAVACHVFPSKRYLNLIISGAREVGLTLEYIEMLESLPTFKTAQSDILKRKALPIPSSLPLLTISELQSKTNAEAEFKLLCVCGYIFEVPGTIFLLKPWRDYTFRKLIHFRGMSMDLHDTNGISPFPVLTDLPQDELDYCYQALDDLIARSPTGQPIAALKEFWEEQGTKQTLY